jgi:hypothetical protein
MSQVGRPSLHCYYDDACSCALFCHILDIPYTTSNNIANLQDSGIKFWIFVTNLRFLFDWPMYLFTVAVLKLSSSHQNGNPLPFQGQEKYTISTAKQILHFNQKCFAPCVCSMCWTLKHVSVYKCSDIYMMQCILCECRSGRFLTVHLSAQRWSCSRFCWTLSQKWDSLCTHQSLWITLQNRNTLKVKNFHVERFLHHSLELLLAIPEM